VNSPSPVTDLLAACFSCTHERSISDERWREAAVCLFLSEVSQIITANPTVELAVQLRTAKLRDQVRSKPRLRSVKS
jgi:hypothetical protein